MTAYSDTYPRRVGTIWTLGQDDPTSEIQPLVEADFRRLKPEEVPALAEAMGGIDPTEIYGRLASERHCYAAWIKDQIAAYGWVSFCEEQVGELKLRVRLEPCEAYIWDCATIPAFRQMGLYCALLVSITRQLQSESVCRIWIGADLQNQPSQKGIDRAGFQRVADLAVREVNGMRQISALGYPGVPESLVAEARRVYLDNRDWVGIEALKE